MLGREGRVERSPRTDVGQHPEPCDQIRTAARPLRTGPPQKSLPVVAPSSGRRLPSPLTDAELAHMADLDDGHTSIHERTTSTTVDSNTPQAHAMHTAIIEEFDRTAPRTRSRRRDWKAPPPHG